AEDAADWILHGVAVAAVDLEGGVGVRPGDARGEQLRHAGLDVAAAFRILLARGEVGGLARHHGLDRHPGELPRDAREGEKLLAELLALEGVAPTQLKRGLGDAGGARRGLDARRFEGRHELLEALPLETAEKILSLHRETVEAELVLLHAAI